MTLDHVPSTLQQLTVPTHVLSGTAQFLRTAGQAGNEGKVFWLGEVLSPRVAQVTELYVPEQIAHRSALGVAVEVPQRAHVALLTYLSPRIFVLAKVHSHPGKAYLSEADDANPAFRHEGAFSIIVPDFARAPLGDLTHCAVFRFTDRTWEHLSPERIRREVQVTT